MSSQGTTPPIVVAEIGCNHKGEIAIAEEMIQTAALFCKVDAVKLQKRNVRELLTPQQYNSPHPNPVNSFGRTYGEHREFLELDLSQHERLKKVCEHHGIDYSTSVWDLPSAKEIAEIDPKWVKIPSACNQNFEMLSWLCENYSGQIHVSLGMTTRDEEYAIVDFFEYKERSYDLILYACTSGYPVAAEDVCLLEVQRLIGTYAHRVAKIGFSGHHLGIAIDVAAMTLGAAWIERHYTLDRTWKGTDHAASLEPDGLRRLSRDLRSVSQALTYKQSDILEVENAQRDKLKWQPTVISRAA